MSPDLNHIENVWAVIKTDLRKLPVSSDSDELFGRLVEIWNGFDALPVVLSEKEAVIVLLTHPFICVIVFSRFIAFFYCQIVII